MNLSSCSFCLLGCISIAIVALQVLRKVFPWFYENIIGPKFCGPKVDLSRMGKWAVVTGSTDGIGKSYAKALAKKGLNLVLISRCPKKLEEVKKEIGAASNVEIKTIQINFTHGSEIYNNIKSQIQGLEIGVLVNNVGISYSYPEYFIEWYNQNPQFLYDIVSANIHSVTNMTALVLPDMVQRKKGVIINLSSTSSVIPNPLLSTYSGTKAFVNKFSADLQTEYRSKGIIIQSVQPGFVATNMTKIRKTSLFAPSSDNYVKSAIRTVGIAEETAGYWPHALLQLGINTIGCVMGKEFARNFVLKNLLDTRKRALRALAKNQ